MRKQYTIAVFLGIFVAVLFYITLEEHFVRKRLFNSHRSKIETSLTEFMKYYFNGNLNYLKNRGLDNNFLAVNLKSNKLITDTKWIKKKQVDELKKICVDRKEPFFHNFKEKNMELLICSKKVNNTLFVVFRNMTVPLKIINQHKVHFIVFLFFLLFVVYLFIKFITEENITEPYKKVLQELRIIRNKGVPHKIDIKVKNEFQDVIDSFNLTVSKLQIALSQLKEKNDFINQQIALASKVQKAFLPSRNLKDKNFSISYRYHAAVYLSGDFFGFKKSHGYIYFYIGDISGKGLSSSLIMSAVSTLMHQAITISAPRPDEIIYDLNSTLEKILPDEKFITLQVFRYSTESGIVEYSNAGHPPPFKILSKKGILVPMPEIPSAPIGFFKVWQKNFDYFKLDSGDKLLLYTDGLTELRDRNGKLLHKFDIFSFLKGSALTCNSERLLDFLSSNVDKYAADEFQDDLTIFIFERTQ